MFDVGVYWYNQSCCRSCTLFAVNVELYYWPEPDADRSCLSIIGDEVFPADYGATTDRRLGVYWGCPTSISGQGIKTIATATLENGRDPKAFHYKRYNVDPYASQPCPETGIGNLSLPANSDRYSLHPTGAFPHTPSSVLWRNHSKVSTVVSGNFTL